MSTQGEPFQPLDVSTDNKVKSPVVDETFHDETCLIIKDKGKPLAGAGTNVALFVSVNCISQDVKGGHMHRVFGSERGFEDKELRTIRATVKQRAPRDASLPEPREATVQKSPSARAKREKVA